MKSILMSIRPKYVADILKGIKMFEIRKKFPKDYVGWVYIYCCKQRKNEIGCHINYEKVDGKVVARFWCDKVEEIKPSNLDNFAKDSCLTIQELENYLWSNICCGYAIHITNLEIFDRPKEISEFGTLTNKCNGFIGGKKPLTKAPQSWCYVEEGD